MENKNNTNSHIGSDATVENISLTAKNIYNNKYSIRKIIEKDGPNLSSDSLKLLWRMYDNLVIAENGYSNLKSLEKEYLNKDAQNNNRKNEEKKEKDVKIKKFPDPNPTVDPNKFISPIFAQSADPCSNCLNRYSPTDYCSFCPNNPFRMTLTGCEKQENMLKVTTVVKEDSSSAINNSINNTNDNKEK